MIKYFIIEVTNDTYLTNNEDGIEVWALRSDGMEKCVFGDIRDDFRNWYDPIEHATPTLEECMKEHPEKWKEISKHEAFLASI
jgi:hypothetical protein